VPPNQKKGTAAKPKAPRSAPKTKTKQPKRQADREALELAEAKLASSGLTLEDAKRLGIDVLSAQETAALHGSFRPRPSIRFSYVDPRDGSPLRPWPSWPAFYRLRYLGEEPKGFEDQAGKKPMRYVQEPDSGLCAYFPALVDWPSVVGDPDVPLIITEGELKAAKACKEGYPAVGLGGVYSYRSSKLGLSFLDELEAVVWVKRHVYIVYDSDFKTNEMVCQALNDLAEELMRRGAMPHVVTLPDVVDGAKTGLDDYLVSVADPDALANLLRERSQPLTIARALWKLNAEVVYVRDPGFVLVQETNQKLAPGAFKDHAYAAEEHCEQVLRADGSVSLKPVSAAAAWLRWPLRREAWGMTYAPGKPKFIEGATPKESRWNAWHGWGVTPAETTKACDVKPFLDLVDHLFTGSDPEAKRWFLQWLAYPLQNPGVKMFSCCLLYGIHHGTGKSLIGYTMKRLYGRNFAEIKQKDIHGDNNGWAENKQFVLGDDITGSDSRHDADVLKSLITQEEMRINIKYVPQFEVPDCINYYFTSNQPDAFFMEDNDRRNFVHEVIVGPLPREFYVAYKCWLDGEGPSLLFRWLLGLDLGGFDPHGPAFETVAKRKMISDVKSDVGAWVHRLRTDPEAVLRVGQATVPGDLFTNRQLLALYDPEGRTRTTANGLGRELRRAGVLQVCGGAPVKGPEGQDRYYIVRNAERWATATQAEVSRYLLGKRK